MDTPSLSLSPTASVDDNRSLFKRTVLLSLKYKQLTFRPNQRDLWWKFWKTQFHPRSLIFELMI